MSADNHTEHLKTAIFELFVARLRSYCFCWGGGDDPSSIRHLVEKHGFNGIFTGLDQYYASTEELIQALEVVY
jgi:hypothetical protein